MRKEYTNYEDVYKKITDILLEKIPNITDDEKDTLTLERDKYLIEHEVYDYDTLKWRMLKDFNYHIFQFEDPIPHSQLKKASEELYIKFFLWSILDGSGRDFYNKRGEKQTSIAVENYILNEYYLKGRDLSLPPLFIDNKFILRDINYPLHQILRNHSHSTSEQAIFTTVISKYNILNRGLEDTIKDLKIFEDIVPKLRKTFDEKFLVKMININEETFLLIRHSM